MTTLPVPVVLMLVATPVMVAFGQVLFKLAGQKLADTGAPFHTVMMNPVFILALIIYAVATLIWIYVLRVAPLAYAYSFMALTFILVPILATLWLGETISIKYILGSVLIVAGLIIAQT